MSNFGAELGKRLRDRRQELNLTQYQIASLVGVHPNYIGLLERAEREASLHRLFDLASALGTTVSKLCNDLVASATKAGKAALKAPAKAKKPAKKAAPAKKTAKKPAKKAAPKAKKPAKKAAPKAKKAAKKGKK